MVKNDEKESGFIEFIRTQGVVGLAVGFILGGSISKVVSSLVEDIVTPFLSPILGATGSVTSAVFYLGQIEIRYGNFLNVLIDFLVIALVVYFGVRKLKLDKLDKK
jgi:large conductance mechanosensitive channel